MMIPTYRRLCQSLMLAIMVAMFYSLYRNSGYVLGYTAESVMKVANQRLRSIFIQNRDVLNIPNVQKKTEAILIVAYMRSGSSFTADILQQSPEVFYIFEPFKRVIGVAKANGLCESNTEKCRLSIFTSQETFNDTYNILTCNFQNVRKMILNRLPDSAHVCKTQEKYKQCLSKFSRQRCVDLLSSDCKNSIPMIKTIRLTGNLTLDLLHKIPGLKIIHLLRDPRGIINSRLKGGFTLLDQVASYSRSLCSRMLADVKTAQIIKEKFSGQLHTVLYERLAENPMVGMEALYSFTKLRLNSKIKHYVKYITTSNKNYGYFNTRRNSKKVASKWRQTLEWSLVQAIDKSCYEFYKFTGYSSISSKSNLLNPDYLPLM